MGQKSVFIFDHGGQSKGIGRDIYHNDALVSIEFPHYMIHARRGFSWHNWEDIDGASTAVNYLLVIPKTDDRFAAHIVWTLHAEAEFNVEFFEGTIVSAPGTEQNVICDNRVKPVQTPGVKLFRNPTIVDVGNSLGILKVGSGTNPFLIEALTREAIGELILAPGQHYLLRVTKVGIGTHWFAYALSWYEVIEGNYVTTTTTTTV